VTPTFNKLHIKGKPCFEFMQVLYASGFPETIFNSEDLLAGSLAETEKPKRCLVIFLKNTFNHLHLIPRKYLFSGNHA
jgi:hypothetical protein